MTNSIQQTLNVVLKPYRSQGFYALERHGRIVVLFHKDEHVKTFPITGTTGQELEAACREWLDKDILL